MGLASFFARSAALSVDFSWADRDPVKRIDVRKLKAKR
jgi:hypothetical protein